MATLVLDNFAGTSLDAAWTRRGVVSGDETWNSPGLTTANVGEGEGYLRAAPSGDFTIEVAMTVSSATGKMFGPWIVNDSGVGVGGTFYDSPAGLLLTTLSGYAYSGSFQRVAAAVLTTSRIRLTKTGGNYTAAYSTDGGGSWSAETAVLAPTFTPTKIGFGGIFGAGGQPTVTFTEFKVTDAAAADPTGTLAALLPPLAVDLAGTYVAPAPTGSLAATLPALTADLAGTYTAPDAAGQHFATIAANKVNGRQRSGRLNLRIVNPLDVDATDEGVPAADGSTVRLHKQPYRIISPSLPAPTLVDGRPQ